jgi:hypothetical protein
LISKTPRLPVNRGVFVFPRQLLRKPKKGKMNKNYKRLPARFGPETRFEVKPAPPAPFRAAQEIKFEALKDQLLRERLEQLLEPQLNSQLRRAANEAAALAWVTRYPLLVFPALFEEKTEAALAHADRQHEINQRSRELLAL